MQEWEHSLYELKSPALSAIFLQNRRPKLANSVLQTKMRYTSFNLIENLISIITGKSDIGS